MTWSVDAPAQRAFVELSGDSNPLHTDPLVARRLPFGRVAVHGMHLLLDALERIVAATDLAPRHITCTFRHPVGVGDRLRTDVSVEGSLASATVTVDVWRAADVTVELGPAPLQPPHPNRDLAAPDACDPEDHDVAALADASGAIGVAAGGLARFGRLIDRIGASATAELVSLTRLVGMHVPGRRSLLSSLDVTLGAPTGRDRLHYRVARADPRFAQVVIDVEGPSLTGRLTTFVRPEPVEPAIGDVRPDPDEFAGQRWLVIGGSRGLGAVCVLLLDAGGADVRFTYHRGAGDAAALAARTRRSTPLQFDVEQSITGALDGWRPTHVAYMASPPIFIGVGGVYSDTLFERFRHVYVERFLAVIDELGCDQLHGVLWPSSSAVGQPPPGLDEYATAKAEGERACARLVTRHPGLRMACPRLPRLPTDQTTTYLPTEFGNPATEMLAALRAAR